MPLFSYPKAQYEPVPFPHAVVQGAWDWDVLRACKAEIATFKDWTGQKRATYCQHKRYSSKPPPSCRKVIDEASGPAFLAWLEALTGERGLVSDPGLTGGGIHSISAGGFLKIHTDFNIHKLGYRRLNVLIYLNEHWGWRGGDLELVNPDTGVSRWVSPEMNNMAIFTTDDKSYHGHPMPLECPENVTRDSIALYYYSPFKPEKNYAAPRTNTTYYD